MQSKRIASMALLFLAMSAPTRAVAAPDAAKANADAEAAFAHIVSGPAKVPLGSLATLDVPAGFKCINDTAGLAAFWRLTQNPPMPSTLAVVIGKEDYWLAIDYDDTGHVNDDERDKFDDKTNATIFKTLADGAESNNPRRKAAGWPTLTLTKWQKPPFYDPQTQHLTWSTVYHDSDGQDTANYFSKILGRTGVMSVTMVADPGQVDKLVPAYNNIVSHINFNAGQRYSEFQSGDRVAAYGLTALAAGGVAVAVAKSKGFGKLIALAVAGVVALFAKIKSFFTGKKPAPATAGGQDSIVLPCPSCGQPNRVRQGQTSPTCVRCGASLA